MPMGKSWDPLDSSFVHMTIHVSSIGIASVLKESMAERTRLSYQGEVFYNFIFCKPI
jgi:hypothetical protein